MSKDDRLIVILVAIIAMVSAVAAVETQDKSFVVVNALMIISLTLKALSRPERDPGG